MAKFLYKSIPEYSREILDILRDVGVSNGEEISVKPLEEYLDNIDTLTFDSIRSYIKGIIDLHDIDRIPYEYLPYLSYILGHVWNYDLDVDYQKYLLKNIVQLYKRKGTRFHIHYNLSYYDPNIEISEPYQNIFILNKSELDSSHVFSSRDRYSWGVYTIKSGYDYDTLSGIIDATRPAGWKAIFQNVSGANVPMGDRPDDDYWKEIQKTDWYKYVYDEAYHNYIIWGHLSQSTYSLLYEDPTGHFVRGVGKNLTLPRRFELNQINNVSSRKRVFTGIRLKIDMGGYGDTGLYVGESFLHNSQFRVEALGSETLYTPDRTITNPLFLGSSTSFIGNPNIVLGSADRTDGGSIFKNFIFHDHYDWSNVGPMTSDIYSIYEIGDRKWLEYNRLTTPYRNTFSAYMGMKMILWSSTSAPFYTADMPYDSYGWYTFDQRDLDYDFFIHRAFSPWLYSRKLENNCRLAEGLLPDDDTIALTDYEDLPQTGVLVLNNEFIEYEKIIDETQWVKFYVDGILTPEAERIVDEFNFVTTFECDGHSFRIEIDRQPKKIIKFNYYRDGEIKESVTDYIIVSRGITDFTVYDNVVGKNFWIRLLSDDPADWEVRINNSRAISESKFLNLTERTVFTYDETDYEIIFDKSAGAIDTKINEDSTFKLGIRIDSTEKLIRLYNANSVYEFPIDQTGTLAGYNMEYNRTTGIITVYDLTKERNIVINPGPVNVKSKYTITIDDTEIIELSTSVLSDRLDSSFTIDNSRRTVYAAADKDGIFQVFYFEGKTLLKRDTDYEVTFLPRTIKIVDKKLNDRVIIIKYHNKPTIPILKRFIRILGWGDTEKSSNIFPKKFKPRLLTRDDMIEYKYKLHKINDMSVIVTSLAGSILKKEIFLGEFKYKAPREIPDHNSVFIYQNSKWNYVSKLDEYEEKIEKEFGIAMVFHSYKEMEDYDGDELEDGRKVLIFSDASDEYHNQVYTFVDNEFVYYGTYTQLEEEKESIYGIKKEFISVAEMNFYDCFDINPGDHVVIISQIVKGLRKKIVELHPQTQDLRSKTEVSITSHEFIGKQILYPYPETVKLIGTHVIDKKYSTETQQTFSLNLGKKQPIDGYETSSKVHTEATLGGTGNQSYMALNRSFLMYGKHHWNSQGAPVTDVSGKSKKSELEQKLYRYLLGERKLLGNKLKVYQYATHLFNIDFGTISFRSRTEFSSSFKFTTKNYLALTTGITTSTEVRIGNIGNLPEKFVTQPKESSFILGYSRLSRTGFKNIVIGSSTSKDWSLENVAWIYSSFDRRSTIPVVTNTKKYNIGSRSRLGLAKN